MNVSQVFSKLVSSQKHLQRADLIETDCAYHGRSAADQACFCWSQAMTPGLYSRQFIKASHRYRRDGPMDDTLWHDGAGSCADISDESL